MIVKEIRNGSNQLSASQIQPSLNVEIRERVGQFTFDHAISHCDGGQDRGVSNLFGDRTAETIFSKKRSISVVPAFISCRYAKKPT